MTDWLKVVLLISGVAGWLIGGTGYKVARRILWPLMAVFLLHPAHFAGWQLGGCFFSLVLVNSLGYGDGVAPIRRSAVLTALAAPSLWLSWHLWVLRLALTGGGGGLLFWLSRRYNKVDWKIAEAGFGLLQAATLIIAT